MTLLDLALAVLAAAFALALARAALGPTVADRAVAADVGFYTIIAVVALAALRTGSSTFLDVVLIATLLGFLAAVSLAALVGRRSS